MIIDACRKAESMVDFTLYDRNNDGFVDLVYVIYAGYGESANDAQGSLGRYRGGRMPGMFIKEQGGPFLSTVSTLMLMPARPSCWAIGEPIAMA